MIDAITVRSRTLVSRLGLAAFLFFFAKGLVWLALALLLYSAA